MNGPPTSPAPADPSLPVSDPAAVAALAGLGVAPSLLSPHQAKALDQDGYVIFPGLIPPDHLERLRARVDELARAEGEAAGSEFEREPGTVRLSNLVDKGEIFDLVWGHPLILACASRVFRRPFKLSSLNGREALRGQGWQGLHADWGRRSAQEPFCVANSLWLLDDFTGENGGTRLVPGSHLWDRPLPERQEPDLPFPGELRPVLPAGSVIFINAHLWHGGTRNTTGDRRRVLHSYYCARDQRQQQDQKRFLRPATVERLSPARRWLLDL